MNNKLVEENFPLVKAIARRMARKLPKWIYFDDLVSAGGEGLMQAAKSFDPTLGFAFTTFARHRIKGAIWDWYRQEFHPRRKTNLHFVPLENESQGHDSPLVVKDKLWHKDPLYFKYDPFTLLGRKDSWEYIKKRSRSAHRHNGKQGPTIVESYYGANASQAEVAKEMGLSESRVSQLHSYVLARYAVLLSMGTMNKDVFCA